ncbi:MAG: biopolymer transporter ExbD [Blastopirellula sp.]|nr:MAG: biopolymer transporter ExbD [Blastopirellula sp.]
MKVHSNLKSGEFGFNMTPMIDVVFLLIIFFLVSSHLAKQESQMPLALPSADSGHEIIDGERERIIVNIDPQGQMLLAGKRVNKTELKQRLMYEKNRSSSDLEVRIRCDRTVAYREVQPIMLACAEAEIWNVVFAVIRKEDAR